jgi:hypothetical protein
VSSIDSGDGNAPAVVPILIDGGDASLVESDGGSDAGLVGMDGGSNDCASPPETSAVFVSTSGSDNAGCGAMTPCKTISAGIVAAHASSQSNIYVDAGTYTETITLVGGIAIHGGWSFANNTWTRICDNTYLTSTIVRGPAPSSSATLSATVVARDLGGAASIDAMVVMSHAAAAASGESLFGVEAIGATTSLAITDVTVQVGAAGAGSDGAAGANGMAGGNCGGPDDGLGAMTQGPSGTVGSASFTADGFVAGTGGNGQDGAVGDTGTVGTGSTFQGQTCTTTSNGMGCELPMAGGSGGPVSTAIGGRAGCGGSPGKGGAGGQGGGSSVAMFVWGATVHTTSGALSSAQGGNGGAGGAGGAGAAGLAGSAGTAGALVASGCAYSSGACRASGTHQATSTSGGSGAASGAGGGGAGGEGGDSYAYYSDSSATISVTMTTLAHGMPGTGGAGATNPDQTTAPVGLNGASGDHN